MNNNTWIYFTVPRVVCLKTKKSQRWGHPLRHLSLLEDALDTGIYPAVTVTNPTYFFPTLWADLVNVTKSLEKFTAFVGNCRRNRTHERKCRDFFIGKRCTTGVGIYCVFDTHTISVNAKKKNDIFAITHANEIGRAHFCRSRGKTKAERFRGALVCAYSNEYARKIICFFFQTSILFELNDVKRIFSKTNYV